MIPGLYCVQINGCCINTNVDLVVASWHSMARQLEKDTSGNVTDIDENADNLQKEIDLSKL